MLLGGSDEGAGLGRGQRFGFALVSITQNHPRGGPGHQPRPPALPLPPVSLL